MENNNKFTFTESGIKALPMPISKNENGKICILDKRCDKSKQVQAGETWECEIIKDEVRSIVLKPVMLWLTKEQNKVIFDNEVQKLKAKYA